MTDYERGRDLATREVGEAHPEDIRDYLAMCEEMGRSEGTVDFDRGYMDRVRELAAREA